MHPPTWFYTVQHLRSERHRPIPLTALTSYTQCSITFFTSTRSIMLFTSTPSKHLATLVNSSAQVKLSHIQPPFSTEMNHASSIIIFSWNSKNTNYAALTRSPTYHSDLYPLPTLSTTLSRSFQNLSFSSQSPSVGPQPTTTHTLTHMILELTHPKSITALRYTSFIQSPEHHLLHTTTLSISENIYPLLSPRNPIYHPYIPSTQPFFQFRRVI